jgi:MFS transporter, DHA3 family, tetracycline resistance protein
MVGGFDPAQKGNTMLKKLHPLAVYYALEGLSAMLFQSIVTIYVVYYATVVGLDPLQIVLIGTLFEVTIFLFEIPTGVVADLYSRRLSILIGLCLTGAALLIEGFIPVFSVILVAEVIMGIGATFLSGATQAWITDEIGVDAVGKAFLRAAQIRILCGMIGIVLSVILASIALALPFITAGALFLMLTLFLIVVMPETGFQQQENRATWQTMGATFREGLRLVRIRPALFLILAIEFVFAFHTEGFDHLWQKHLLDNFTFPALDGLNPVVWFGVIAFGANVCSIGLHEIARRRVDFNSHAGVSRSLMLLYAVIAVGIVVFSLTGHLYVAMAAYWLVTALRSTARPINEAWLNQNIEPRTRATMFSMMGQVGSFGETIGGMPVGAVGKVFSLRLALFSSAGILTLTLPLFLAALKREQPAALEEQMG